jgi:hypothetical protein
MSSQTLASVPVTIINPLKTASCAHVWARAGGGASHHPVANHVCVRVNLSLSNKRSQGH